MYVNDVIAAMAENLEHSISCQFESMDPAELIEEVEERLIEVTGVNFAGL